MIIRPAIPADHAAIAAIYGHHVEHGYGTFEEAPPSEGEISTRIAAVLDRGLPYLVAEADGAVIGFAYASPFRPRAAYRYTVEDSVYVAPDAQGRGVGKALLAQVIAACEGLGLRQILAVIGDSANAGSIGLHGACGFSHAGLLPAVGWKHGRWVDSVLMTRPLGLADQAPPPAGR